MPEPVDEFNCHLIPLSALWCLIINGTVGISAFRGTSRSLCYTCHCAGVVVSLSNAETRPSIRAVQRCFVRSNSISEFFYGTHHISKQTPGQCALRCLHKAGNTHSRPAVCMGTNPHTFPPGGFNNNKKIHEWESGVHSNRRQSWNVARHENSFFFFLVMTLFLRFPRTCHASSDLGLLS